MAPSISRGVSKIAGCIPRRSLFASAEVTRRKPARLRLALTRKGWPLAASPNCTRRRYGACSHHLARRVMSVLSPQALWPVVLWKNSVIGHEVARPTGDPPPRLRSLGSPAAVQKSSGHILTGVSTFTRLCGQVGKQRGIAPIMRKVVTDMAAHPRNRIDVAPCSKEGHPTWPHACQSLHRCMRDCTRRLPLRACQPRATSLR